MKKTLFFSLIVNVCIVFMIPMFTVSAAAQLPGDATGDGKIGLDDAIYSLQVVSGIRVSALTVTGRWELTGTHGEMSGIMGLLLTQSGSLFAGTAIQNEIHDGAINGNQLSGWFDGDGGRLFTFSLEQVGEELHGTFLMDKGGQITSIPVIFHRESLIPISPYSGRPSVLSARCEATYELYNGVWRRNGLYIIIKWNRPVTGWNFKITGYGMTWDGNNWADQANFAYDPLKNEYTLSILPNIGINPAPAQYTFTLESASNTWDSVNWHDPYGAAAWNNPSLAYSFVFSCPPPPQ
jgi:hypothetical protein